MQMLTMVHRPVLYFKLPTVSATANNTRSDQMVTHATSCSEIIGVAYTIDMLLLLSTRHTLSVSCAWDPSRDIIIWVFGRTWLKLEKINYAKCTEMQWRSAASFQHDYQIKAGHAHNTDTDRTLIIKYLSLLPRIDNPSCAASNSLRVRIRVESKEVQQHI